MSGQLSDLAYFARISPQREREHFWVATRGTCTGSPPPRPACGEMAVLAALVHALAIHLVRVVADGDRFLIVYTWKRERVAFRELWVEV